MSDSLDLVELLTGDNHPVWEVTMRALFIHKGFGKVTIRIAGEDDESTDCSKSEQALSMLILALEEDHMVQIAK